MALLLVRAYIAFIDSNQILIMQRAVVSDHFAETPYPHPNGFNWIYKMHSLWSLRTLGPTFLPGTATCWAHLFQNSKTGCLLCSVKMPTRESFLKDHSHRHCQEKEFLARKEPGSIWEARWWFQFQLNSCWKVFELQMRKASMTNFQARDASEENGKCWDSPNPNSHMHTYLRTTTGILGQDSLQRCLCFWVHRGSQLMFAEPQVYLLAPLKANAI